MTARELVDALGDRLVGRMVDTEAIGEWPGGVAEVYAMSLDPAAPEIVFNVRHPIHGEMGIFECEDIRLVKEES